ncbi:MAG: malonyl-CoA decarboxylase [Dinoroseobacter sp.]|nr:malonyl-CoA decarboxylase [Dinoroseobacter sp.]MDJ0991979.1 malonyl-CoA decarboxylase [Dinoroseobacter sp.]
MSLMADLLGTIFERRYRAGVPDPRSLSELSEALLSSSGEGSGGALARALLDRYERADTAERAVWFSFLTDQLDLDIVELTARLVEYGESRDPTVYRSFMSVAEPPRQELIRRLNQVPGATARLVGLRADLLSQLPDWPALGRVDADIRHLFKSWFNRGFLVLRPITWESPAHILEKIIAYEAVHAIDRWSDLRARLEPSDRRCFAFFHPAMPDEPLIFVEVALTKGVPGSIQSLLAEDREQLAAADADTAVFYSISNCQAGLAGISFGNSLIKQVVRDLARDLPQLSRFVTLSPIPGLMKWVSEAKLNWPEDAENQRALAAHYLAAEKARAGRPRDPVARFHLGNGALIHQVHAAADLSENGLRQSGGVMVNYLYDLDRVSDNHEAFVSSGAVASSKEVSALARKGAPEPQRP